MKRPYVIFFLVAALCVGLIVDLSEDYAAKRRMTTRALKHSQHFLRPEPKYIHKLAITDDAYQTKQEIIDEFLPLARQYGEEHGRSLGLRGITREYTIDYHGLVYDVEERDAYCAAYKEAFDAAFVVAYKEYLKKQLEEERERLRRQSVPARDRGRVYYDDPDSDDPYDWDDDDDRWDEDEDEEDYW